MRFPERETLVPGQLLRFKRPISMRTLGKLGDFADLDTVPHSQLLRIVGNIPTIGYMPGEVKPVGETIPDGADPRTRVAAYGPHGDSLASAWMYLLQTRVAKTHLIKPDKENAVCSTFYTAILPRLPADYQGLLDAILRNVQQAGHGISEVSTHVAWLIGGHLDQAAYVQAQSRILRVHRRHIQTLDWQQLLEEAPAGTIPFALVPPFHPHMKECLPNDPFPIDNITQDRLPNTRILSDRTNKRTEIFRAAALPVIGE